MWNSHLEGTLINRHKATDLGGTQRAKITQYIQKPSSATLERLLAEFLKLFFYTCHSFQKRFFCPSNSFIIPEGASCIESLPGALTLGQDIERNEKEYTLCFKHLFIESGSGFSAYALALYAYLFKKPWKIHCLILADKSKQEFLNRCMSWLQTPEHQESLAYLIPFFPLTNASFGSTSPSNFNFIRDIAQREGFLIDPIYSAKLLKESNLYIKDNRLIPSSCCIIHSGGALSLSGFSSQLQQLLSK